MKSQLPDSSMAGLRVALIGPSTAVRAPGGGEVQLMELARALHERGVSAHADWPAGANLPDVDLLHLFGSVPEHNAFVEEARRREVPVALSPIAWFDWASRFHAAKNWPDLIRGVGGMAARQIPVGWPDWRRRLYRAVDVLLPNSHAEAQQLRRLFRVEPGRLVIVPNAASDRFAEGDPTLFERHYGLRDFVLYAGRLEPRKNPHGFLRAMRGCNLPIVMLGDPPPGCRVFAEQLRRLAGPRTQFIARIDHGSPLLASAYAACRCLALASWFETPGLVALEAGMSGVPLVLTDRGATREYFGPLARYVSPGHSGLIRHRVSEAYQRPRDAALAEHVRTYFTWQHAAQHTLRAYARALGLADSVTSTMLLPHVPTDETTSSPRFGNPATYRR